MCFQRFHLLYKGLVFLSEFEPFSVLNVFRYITFRSFLCFFTSFFVCFFFGPLFIRGLKNKKLQQSIRDDGPQAHAKKGGTPTMGGGLILISLSFSSLLWVDLFNPLILATLGITIGFALIGFVDDHVKISNRSSKGVRGCVRLSLEFLLSFVVLGFLFYRGDIHSLLPVPFFKELSLDLSWFYVPFACLVIVGSANAVNLTDGLDGLAIVPVIICAGTFSIFSYVAGHYQIAEYLGIPFISGGGELAPLASSVVAAGLGFLWYNTYPAQIFMGDVGSLGLGGFLGAMATLTKNELLLMLVGGIFVVEALSVMGQVLSFRLTGKRIFKMAPLHHHFEMKGHLETKIIVRFWIVAILLAILGLSTLKLR